MNEKNTEMTPQAEESRGGAPQDLSALAAEVSAMEKKAASSWKIALVGWAILLAIIFSYLNFWLLQSVIKPAVQPAELVALGFVAVDAGLESRGLSPLESSDLVDEVTRLLKERVPIVIEEQVRPRLVDLQERLPELREEWTEEVRQKAPELMADAVDRLQADLLPKAHDTLLEFVRTRVDDTLAQVEETIDRAVGEVVDSTDQSIIDLADNETLRLNLEVAFEEQMGEVLDALFTDLDKTVAEAGRGIRELVAKMDAGTLEKRDMLELRAIQLTRALFTSLREAVPEAEGEGEDFFQKLMGTLKDLKIEPAARRTILLDAREGVAPDLSQVPEELREEVRKEAQEFREAAQKAAGDLPGAPEAGAAPRTRSAAPEGPPPEVLKRIQEEQEKEREEAAKRAAQ